MSFPLHVHARAVVRSATISVLLLAFAIPSLPAAAVPAAVFTPETGPADAVAPQLPWTSVSDVLAATLLGQKAATTAVAEVEPAPAPEPASEHRVFATVDGLELREPSTEILEIGFHEGSTQGRSLHPVGRVVGNESRMTAPADVEGPDYRILASRGRGVGASTAVDIAMDEGVPVHGMVTGTVVSVSDYSLYGRTTDVLIEIVPDAAPTTKVQVFHVRDPQVAAGDRVTEDMVIASPRLLPFGSQIDRHVGHAGPHIHVQVVGA